MRLWRPDSFLPWLSLTLGGIVAALVASATDPFLEALTLGLLAGAVTGGAIYLLVWLTLWRGRRE